MMKLFDTYSIPTVEYTTIKNANGDNMNAKIVYPPNFDPSKKYPVLMNPYGGPNSQTVNMKYNVGFMYFLTSNDVITLIVDGRGTGFKGRAYRTCVASHLGMYEIQDQIEAAKYMAKLEYVDSKRIGIWGWSYGGYVTSKVVEADSRVFSLAMAVAPVTDWKFYDTVYTERFMKTPVQNPVGYLNSAVTSMEGFKHVSFLMIHGTADDNVHFQNSAELVWHLTGAGIKDYTAQYYTDSDHSIYENGANSLVYGKMLTFLCDKWGLSKCSMTNI